MPDENDKHTGPKAPAQNAPGPNNPRPSHAQPDGNTANPQQNYPTQVDPGAHQNPAGGLQWAQSGQAPDLFANVPGYQPHSFGQPVTQPVVNTSFAQQQLANLAAMSGTAMPGAAPAQPQGFGEPIIDPNAHIMPHAYGQPQPGAVIQPGTVQHPGVVAQPGLMPQPGAVPQPGIMPQQSAPGYPAQMAPGQPSAPGYQPQPLMPQGYNQSAQSFAQAPQPALPAPGLPAPSAEIPQLKLPPKPPSQQKPMNQMLPYQYQYQSQQGPQEPQLAPQYTPQRSPQFQDQNQKQEPETQSASQNLAAAQNQNLAQNPGQIQSPSQAPYPTQYPGQAPVQGQMQGQVQNQPQNTPYNYSQDNTLNRPLNNAAQDAANAQALAQREQQAQVWQRAQQQWQLQPKSTEQLAQEQAARSSQSQQPNPMQMQGQVQGQGQGQTPGPGPGQGQGPQGHGPGQVQNQGQGQGQIQSPGQIQPQTQGIRPPNQQYQPTPKAVSSNYAGSDAGRAPNSSAQYESKDFVPKTPPVINTGQDPNKPWASSSEPQFELFAEEYEEAIRFAQKAREQNQNTAPAKPSVWQEKLAEAAAATEVPVPKVLPTVQPAATAPGTPGQAGGRPSALSDALDTVAQPQLSRGAAALRAAGIYNKSSSSREAEEPLVSSFKISKQDIFGLIAYNLLIAKTICADPKGFFAKMPDVGAMAEPIIFLLVIELIASLARCVTTFSLKPLFADLIMSLISTVLGAFVVSLVFDKAGGKGNFNSTLRVLCFSKAPILIAFLGIAQFQIGTLAALVYGMYLNFIGLRKTQKLDTKTTISIIVVLGIMGALFRGNAP